MKKFYKLGIKNIIALFLFSLLIISQRSLSQENTLLSNITLTEAKVSDRIAFKNHVITDSIIKENIATNIGELLSTKTPIYIRDYGTSGSRVPSLRGMGPNHTQVYWNGINLTSPMLGQSDLSLPPVFFSDEIKINYGGTSLLYGTGGIGGAIHINSNPERENKFSLLFSQTIQGFADYYIPDFRIPNYTTNFSTSFKANFGEHIKTDNTIKVYNKSAKNNFLFTNLNGDNDTSYKNENSQEYQRGLLAETSIKIYNHRISYKIWLQDSEKHLPIYSMDITKYYSIQKDKSVRILKTWQMDQGNLSTKLDLAYLREYINYQNDLFQTDSKSTVNSAKANICLDYSVSDNLIFGGGYNLNLDIVDNDNYLDPNTEEKISRKQQVHDFFLKTDYNYANRLNFNLLVRQQILDSNIMPFLPSLGISLGITKNILLKTNATRSFRAPTLNERYWYPGGNENLKPEEGWTYELGVLWKHGDKQKDIFSSSLESNIFFSKVDNWIIWVPTTSNIYIWQPENLKLVQSKGVENTITLFYRGDNYSLENFYSISFVWSQNTEAYDKSDKSVGHQLIYTPIENLQTYLRLNYKDWKFTIEEQYIGKRYTVDDGSEYLPAYYMTNLIIAKGFTLNRHKFSSQFRMNNVFNHRYQAMYDAPMPTVNFYLTLSYKFQ